MLSTILFILMAYSVYLIFKMFKMPEIALIFKIIIIFSWFFWFFMPYVLTSESFDWFDQYLKYPDYLRYYIYDAIYWITAFYIFLLMVKRKYKPVRWLRFSDNFQNNNKFNAFMLVFCIIVSLINVYNVLVSPITYLEINDAETAGNSNPILAYFSTICIAYIYYVVFYRFNTVPLVAKILIVLIVLMDVVGKLLHGNRICLILPVLILLYFYLSSRKSVYAIVGISFVAVGLILAPIVASQRTSDDGSMSVASTTFDAIKTELIIKSNSVYYGASYLNSGGWAEGGFRVTLNSLLSNVPMPNKPVPISIDGTYETNFGRLAGNLRLSSYNSYVNVGTAPSQHPLWVYGWPGYIIYVLFAGVLLWILNYWFKSGLAFPALFSLMFVNFPNCNILKSFDSILRDFPRYILFYIFFYIIAHIFFTSYKRTQKQTI